MNAWILILFMTGQTEGGNAVTSIRFKSEKGCQTALAKLPQGMIARWGRQVLYAICVEDK